MFAKFPELSACKSPDQQIIDLLSNYKPAFVDLSSTNFSFRASVDERKLLPRKNDVV
jgi:hypothetical protein